jgi:hypothetical protein
MIPLAIAMDHEQIHLSTSRLMDAADFRDPNAFFKAYHSISQVLEMLLGFDFEDNQSKTLWEKSLIMMRAMSLKGSTSTELSAALCSFLSETFINGFAITNGLKKNEVCRKLCCVRVKHTIIYSRNLLRLL